MTARFAFGQLSDWDPPPGGLGDRARAGVRQTASIRFVSVGVQFLAAAILARILGPAAFGLVALANLITGFAALFARLGVGPALVQREKLTDVLLVSAFFISSTVALLFGFGVALSAALVESFFDADGLAPVLQISAVTMVVAVGLVPRSLLQRRLRFGAVMALDLTFGLISAAVSLGLATAGVGVLSIPIGAAVATCLTTCLAFGFCPWRPRGLPTRAAVRSLWSYSGSLFASDTLDYWGKNIDNLLVGKIIGAAALGYYARAFNLMQLPVANLTQILNSVLFPTLSRVKDDTPRFERGWISSCRLAVFLGIGVAIAASVNARDLVALIYGAEWLPMTTALAVLMCATPAYILATNASVIFMALGRTGLQLKLGLVSVGLRVVSIVIGVQWGYEGVAVAILVSSYLNLAVVLVPSLRVARIRWGLVAHACRWLLIGAALGAAAGLLVQYLLPPDTATLVRLSATSLAIAGLYVPLSLFIDRALLHDLRGRS